MGDAREAAWEIYNLAYRDDIPVVRAEKDAILAVHAAGVTEGIQQARQAAAKFAPLGDGSYESDWEQGFRVAHKQVLRAIDALEQNG